MSVGDYHERRLRNQLRFWLRRDGALDCTVENLNMLGAYISFDANNPTELPHKFDLTFDNCHTYWHCDVIWQDGDIGRVGVSWKTS